MMSKGLFFKAAREDLRHKVWMIALSVLGSFLTMPVSWLLMWNNMAGEMDTMRGETVYFVGRIYEFFSDYYILFGGCVTVLGALIVGLFGFRYLFHQGMVDTWHSLPVKRGTLFGICYVDGFLIWFVPAFIGLLSTVVMAGRFAYQMGGGQALIGMLKEAVVSLVVLMVVFFLVYDMVLVAVMLSGNMLNTLVSMMILGFGALAVYGLGVLFFTLYMETFYIEGFPGEAGGCLSPFFSALYLLFIRCGFEDSGELWKVLLGSLGIGAALGVCAWLLYKRRASELAEQGMCSRAVGMVMRVVMGVAAGMCGWQLFVMFVLDTAAVGWGMFGAALGTILVFGILDVIFRMEFKAFFAHKIQMAGTFALTLLLCFAFYWDWFGYDVYLPDKEEIAEIAVSDIQFTNRPFSAVHEEPLKNMVFRDTEAIYAYLKAMTDTQVVVDKGMGYYPGKYDRVKTKVTLEGGRSYYRYYYVLNQDKEAIWPLLSNEEYMKYAYCIEETRAAECISLVMTRNGESVRLSDFKPEEVASIIHAYNEDVLEDPETALLGGGRLLVRMEIVLGKEGDKSIYTLDIYESMGHVLEALRLAGYQRWIVLPESSNVRSVELPLKLYAKEPVAKETILAQAREVYGVKGEDVPVLYPETAAEDWTEENYRDSMLSVTDRDEKLSSVDAVIDDCKLSVTDRAEVEELLALISNVTPYKGSNVFREDYVEIYVEDMEGNRQVYFIKMGLLPEKYLLRFGEER